MFFNFLNFFAIFFGILQPRSIGKEFGTKIFFYVFLSLYHPGLDRNNARMIFFEFFSYFYWYFLAWVGQKLISGLNFFSPFLGLSNPGLDKNNAGMMFFNSLNLFFLFFLEFSNLGKVRTKFGTKIVFSLFQPISTLYGLKFCRNDVF